jgi:predicted metal-dependent phosphoesterase TrpH
MDFTALRLVPCSADLTANTSVKIVLIDFHTHTTASDGALAPEELLARAAAAGVDMLAITDHDSVAGYLALAAAGAAAGAPQLVSGVEFSCRWSGATVHIVGLGIDCAHPALRAGVARMDTARLQRGEKIGRQLAGRGFPGALQGALQEAGDSQLGRPHFAAWLVREGHVRDHAEAFDRYLGRGKPGDVKAFWPELAEVVEWIVAAGGVAVIAHPLKYRFTGMKLRRLVIDFKAAGGEAMEVASGYRTRDQLAHLRRLVQEYGLEVSVGSDFHRDGPYSAALGVELAPFAELPGVWARWQTA